MASPRQESFFCWWSRCRHFWCLQEQFSIQYQTYDNVHVLFTNVMLLREKLVKYSVIWNLNFCEYINCSFRREPIGGNASEASDMSGWGTTVSTAFCLPKRVVKEKQFDLVINLYVFSGLEWYFIHSFYCKQWTPKYRWFNSCLSFTGKTWCSRIARIPRKTRSKGIFAHLKNGATDVCNTSIKMFLITIKVELHPKLYF